MTDTPGVCLPSRAGTPSSSTWYAVRVRANREFKVRDALEASGIPVFLPTWSEEVRWSDRTKVVTRVLFPGYVMAQIDSALGFFAVTCMRGVVRVLPDSMHPCAIDEREIEDVRRILAAGLAATPCAFAAGDQVTIESGPLAGVAGVVDRTEGSVHVVVSIVMLNRAVRVKVDADMLMPREA